MAPNFSVVLIARNEEKTLPLLLASLTRFKERGGEVVLVDTGSTDQTAQVAREAGCKVEEVGDRFRRAITAKQAYDINRFGDHTEPPIIGEGDTLFDFSAARNYAASLASNDVVAMPDCDEIYTKLDLDKVCEAIADGAEQLEYNFVFAHDERGRELIKFLHSKFYDRRKLRWTGIIHEVLEGNARRKFFGEDIIKLEHWQNHETNRGGYLKGLALSVLEDPANDRHAHYFGRELLYTRRPLSAIKELKRHIAMGKWPEERSQSLIHIGDALMQLGKTQEAIHTWIDAFDTCPTRRESFMKIAEYYRSVGCPEHVIGYVSAAKQIPPNNFYASYQPYYEGLPDELLAWARTEISLRGIELPSVSIIIPTLRPDGLERTLASIKALNYPKEKGEVIIVRDEPREGVAKRLKEGVAKAKGEWLVYAADDMEFTPDCLKAAYAAARTAGKRFVAFNAGLVSTDEGNICEHFMLHRSLLEVLPKGEIFDTDFHHVGVDNLLWAIMQKAGEAIRCEDARFIHHHFSRGEMMDAVHRIGWDPECVARDRALLKDKLAAL